jgi:uncharacterized protein YceH (UPF0502 family)
MLELSATQARVLGALVEKQLTTPESYPLTLNALVTACNQTSNRDPVLHLEHQAVETAVLALKAHGLARVVHPGSGERATKYRQVAEEALSLPQGELALLCVLLLRGPQTAAELRARSERLYTFSGAGEVESVLASLAEQGLVTVLDRLPGQKEPRWLQLLEVGAEERAAASSSSSMPVVRASSGHLQELEARVAALESKVADLVHALGDLVELPMPDSPA